MRGLLALRAPSLGPRHANPSSTCLSHLTWEIPAREPIHHPLTDHLACRARRPMGLWLDQGGYALPLSLELASQVSSSAKP